MPVHLSVCIPLNVFSWNLIFENFSKICRRISSFKWNLTRISGTLHADLCTFYDKIGLNFLILRNFSDCCGENQNTHFIIFSNFLPEKVVTFVRQCGKMLHIRTGHRWHNAAHSLCMLDNKGYKHTVKMCDTYCFPTANIVTLTRHNIIVYFHCLSG